MKSFYQLIRHEGNRELFHAVEMSVAAIANNYPFHLHVEGLRGTGKTTILRAAAAILPPITRIRGCLYNCDPLQPHCPEHRQLSALEIEAIGVETIPCPFFEISHSAKAGTVVGSIDLSRLTDPLQPAAALLPGTIPQAHRGVILVDEINRLADTAPEIADILLDVMGTKPGRVQIEESGLTSVAMPVQVSIWAASNPDEEPGALSQIRRQLSDRFDIGITMGRATEIEAIINILTNKTKYVSSKEQFYLPLNLYQVKANQDLNKTLAEIYVEYNLESLRSLEAMATASKLSALLAGEPEVTLKHLAAVVPMVMSHRLDPTTIANILKYLDQTKSGKVLTLPVFTAEPKRPASDVLNQPAAAPTANRVKTWWNQLQQKLAARRTKAQQSTKPQASGTNKAPARPAGGKAAQTVANPEQITIVAPAKPAVPLAGLAVDEFVSSEQARTEQ